MKTALVLACDDGFIPFTSVAARRIASYAREKFPIVILSDGVTDDNKARARKFCPQIEFIEAAPLFANRPMPTHSSFTRAVHLRMFLDELLADFDRAVYLDSDISPLTDVSPLLAMAPKAAPLIATYDIFITIDGKYRRRLPVSNGSAYFNSGVMVVDLKAVRSERIFADALEFSLQHPELCIYPDQDALNVAVDGRWQVLDWRWNAVSFKLDRLTKQPFLRHLTGNKPWSPQKQGVEQYLIEEWRSDLSESPWSDRFQEAARYSTPELSEPSFASKVSDAALRLLYSRIKGRRGNRIRFDRRFATVLHNIETAAGEGRLADRFPEVTLVA
jgi:lipopolysaccharide biosynthesis glycosyltransferase